MSGVVFLIHMAYLINHELIMLSVFIIFAPSQSILGLVMFSWSELAGLCFDNSLFFSYVNRLVVMTTTLAFFESFFK